MYLIAIAWIYVVLMMAVAEATSSQGTVLGALITFMFYGALPLGIVLYIFATPARKRLIRDRMAREDAEGAALPLSAPMTAPMTTSPAPDRSGHPPRDAAAPEGKEV